MSSYNGHKHQTTYECVDQSPEFIEGPNHWKDTAVTQAELFYTLWYLIVMIMGETVTVLSMQATNGLLALFVCSK